MALFVVKANCQITFNKIDSLEFEASLAFSLVENDSFYFVSGIGLDDVDSFYVISSYLQKINKNGETIDLQMFVDSTNERTYEQGRNNLRNSKDGNFFQSGYQRENGEIDPYMIKFDDQGEIIFQTLLKSKFEEGNGFELDADYIELPNGEIITVTRCQRNDQGNNAAAEICIYKLSSEGEILWQKVIEDPDRRDVTTQLLLHPNGNIVILGGKNRLHVDLFPLTWSSITEIDIEGELINQWESEPLDSLGAISSGIIVKDEYILSTDIWIELYPDVQTIVDPTILKLDKNFNEVWRFSHYNVKDSLFAPGLGYSKLIELSDSKFIAVGISHIGDIENVNGDFSDEFGKIIKFNGDGEILWERNYQYFGDEAYFDNHVFNDVIETNDGGFLACGEIKFPIGNTKRQYSWLVKMDEYGCIVPGCQDIIDNTITVSKTADLKLFPNPVSDVLNVAVNHQGSFKDARIIISNSLGQRIKSYRVELPNLTMMMDVSGLQAGTYFLTYVVEGVVLKTEGFIKR